MSKAPRTIELGGQKHPLVVPTGFARLDLQVSYPGNEAPMPLRFRWAYGALALCWAGPPKGWPDLASCKHDLMAWGEEVQRGLEAAGLLGADPVAASYRVHNCMIGVLNSLSVSQEELDQARDFSSPPSDGVSGEAAPRP